MGEEGALFLLVNNRILNECLVKQSFLIFRVPGSASCSRWEPVFQNGFLDDHTNRQRSVDLPQFHVIPYMFFFGGNKEVFLLRKLNGIFHSTHNLDFSVVMEGI